MKISPKTKISALIKENPAAIEAIASISSHFEKLRNPILRKILASRVTIADAARIGGAQVADFYLKLEAIGFEPELDSKQETEPAQERKTPPADLPAKTVQLDVREALETGNDPFHNITDLLEKLEPNQALELINTFEPTPLLEILGKRGYRHYTDQKSKDLVHTYFYRTVPETTQKVMPATPSGNTPAFETLLQQHQGKILEIDVRHLEMPQPMVTILEALEKLEPGEILYVHHKRVPQFLLPQLHERGYTWQTKELGPEQVQLLIYKI